MKTLLTRSLLLGLLFLLRPNIGVATIAIWLGIGALLYGALQLALAFYMRRRARQLAASGY